MQASLVLIVWLVVGVLAFLLVQVLARGRARALRMVEEKTGQLRHQALHDALTNLPNRALIMDRAEQMLAHARRDGTEVSAMFIDLDGFKGVNDTFGHPVGDELLRVVAARISNVLRDTDTIGRLGGDEFVVLVEGGPEKIAERILAVLQEPFELGTGSPITITTSIGIATGDREAAKDLLRDADIALYEAKGAGRNRYAEFRHEMHIAAHDRLELESDLRGAIAPRRALPRLPAALDLETGEVSARRGAAALAARHPRARPADRVHHARRGQRDDRRASARGCSRPPASRPPSGTRAATASASRSTSAPASSTTRASRASSTTRSRRSGLDPDLLVLEITETALMRDAEAAADVLRELKAFGVHVAIDDFGTGYSSLAYLQQLPVDGLKIDRTFIAASARSRDDDPLISTLVQLGRSLELATVAEGIEDEAQLARLRELGCDFGQGYLFAPPLEATALERFLEEHTPAFA